MPQPLKSKAQGQPLALITTADDFGLAPGINRGIITAHTRGLLRSTALMMNGPSTAEAVALAKAHPSLEVGIHLGIVEGLSLLGRPSSLSDDLAYFGGSGPASLCLHRAWPNFAKRYLRGAVVLQEVEAELDLQLAAMQAVFGQIPFANGTQHLHLVPGVLEVVLKLLQKYKIKHLRLPGRSLRVPGFGRRRFTNAMLAALGRRATPKAAALGITGARHFAGFDACGQLTTERLCAFLETMPEGTTELMMHPGEDCPDLRAKLPWAYNGFSWQTELAALTSDGARAVVTRRNIALIQFKDLPT